MSKQTFAEKIFGASAGSIVFRKPDIILTHDNTASIESTFKKMGGDKVSDPDQLLVVLDHNAPPTNSKLANDYQQIRIFVRQQGIKKFHNAGEGICHQLMAEYARPGMVIVGSDSHTCTAGAFNAFATGIDRTETAGLWKQGETWFMVPQSLKIILKGKLPENVYAKDLALHIIGMIGSSGADYMSVEYHGDGVKTLTIADRMTIANLASEMGAKNAVFPADDQLYSHTGKKVKGVWADPDAHYIKEYVIDLKDLFPLVSCPHHVDNVKSVDELADIKIGQALIGTCTNGRLEDLRIAASLMNNKKIADDVQLLIIPASRDIYLQAIKEGLAEIFLTAGANILTPSCGPCLGTGQGIPSDGINVISTANRNFLGRMGNPKAAIFLASPATVALSAIHGEITSPSKSAVKRVFPYHIKQSDTVKLKPSENRYTNGVWNYKDTDNLNTDQMFAGNLTYEINSSQPEKIVPYLLKGFDVHFSSRVQKEDIIICGRNFGCGSSREHPAVGLVYAGVKAVLVKSVSRIFFRSAINQGLPVLVIPEAIDAYKPGDSVDIDMANGRASIGGTIFSFNPLPAKLMQILEKGGLVKWINSE
ncbi:MAG: 3-isopropylmalate dehydratase large subunit [Bacteroidales bacterium]|nr:3-isopropylmalate dehydratase large subunit [Bacteroidales bacterium]MBN2763920.1 3-isopropylmalate dehydratase large subunit [Bacteroidales bacterium]